MSSNTLRDRENVCIYRKLDVTPIEDKVRKNWLRWFGHVLLSCGA